MNNYGTGVLPVRGRPVWTLWGVPELVKYYAPLESLVVVPLSVSLRRRSTELSLWISPTVFAIELSP